MSQGVTRVWGDPAAPPREEKRAESIYLDHNATTPLDPRVLEAMARVWRDCGANPASQHAAGRRARKLVEEAREGLLALLGAKTSGMTADRLFFTSGGTEANHLALQGLLDPAKPTRGIALSALEHPSLVATAEQIHRRGLPLLPIPVSTSGCADLDEIARLVGESEENQPQLLTLMLASNETGVLQPVGEVVKLARDTDIVIHTDAVQAIGKIPVGFRDLGVAAMTIAAHKLHGPVGIGGLVLRNEVKLEPQLFGGFQQGALRPGTENAALAAGFFQAVELAHYEAASRWRLMRELRDQLQSMITQQVPTSVVIGGEVPRTPQTLCIAFPPLDRQALVMALDLAGVACSTGSACASGSSEPSPTLVAMGLPPEVIGSAIRCSLGAFTTASEVRLAAERIIKTIKQLQSSR
jgi:cysteine desulfurase